MDTWSYGILLYYLFYGFLPFDSDLNLSEIKKKICEDDVIFPNSLKISDDLKQLITLCLSKDPLKRISIDQIKLSKWFDWFMYSNQNCINRDIDSIKYSLVIRFLIRIIKI